MTKDEFITGYAEKSGVSIEFLMDKRQVVLKCDCEDEFCQGWRLVTMSCKTCGTVLKNCIAKNSKCTQESHWYCEKCNEKIGFGIYDPCYELGINI